MSLAHRENHIISNVNIQTSGHNESTLTNQPNAPQPSPNPNPTPPYPDPTTHNPACHAHPTPPTSSPLHPTRHICNVNIPTSGHNESTRVIFRYLSQICGGHRDHHFASNTDFGSSRKSVPHLRLWASASSAVLELLASAPCDGVTCAAVCTRTFG